jgi:hypothetical protein
MARRVVNQLILSMLQQPPQIKYALAMKLAFTARADLSIADGIHLDKYNTDSKKGGGGGLYIIFGVCVYMYIYLAL